MAMLFLYCFSNCDFVGTWQHFLMFLGFKNLCGFFAFQIPAWIGADYFFGNTWQHFIFFLDLYINIFVVSLHSKPLHGLELTSVSTISGNKCCHGNTFLLFIGLMNNFMGSLHSITLHRLELISVLAISGNTFLLFLGPIYKYSFTYV